MGRQPNPFNKVPTGKDDLDRLQDRLVETLRPISSNPMLAIADFRFVEVPGNPPSLALQFRGVGGAWSTVATFTSAGVLLADATWTAPTLLNSWVNEGGSSITAGYMKDASGFVHLRGGIKNGTINAVAFNLPAGYRPSGNMGFMCASYSSVAAGAGVILPVVVLTTGDVIVGNDANGSNFSASINGITFDTRA